MNRPEELIEHIQEYVAELETLIKYLLENKTITVSDKELEGIRNDDVIIRTYRDYENKTWSYEVGSYDENE